MSVTPKIKLIVVVGPTASGKTGLGIQLAQAIGGEIVSADSMQIYRYMNIGTAKPTPAELTKASHHLIDCLDPKQPYNAGKFVEDADRCIREIDQRGKFAIVLGGTSLYIRALVQGIIPVPDTPPKLKEEVHGMVEREGLAKVYERLKALDPKSASPLHPNDVSRICRAMEVVLQTGRSIQEFQNRHRFQSKRYDAYFLGVRWPREILYERINRRIVMMIDEGLIEEVESLLQRGYDESLPSMKSIGYKQACQYLKGEFSKEEMIADIQQKTRHYAKKQMTWYRKDESVVWLDQGNLTEEVKQDIVAFLHPDAKTTP